jgi:choline dehydrogenase
VGSNLGDHPSVWVDAPFGGAGRDAPNLSVIGSFHSEERADDDAPDLLLWIADPEGDPPEFGCEAILMKPESRGSVSLRSADPQQPPRIRLPGLQTESDRARMRQACLRAFEVLGLGAGDLDELIRAELYSVPHTVGTCAMGPRPDDGAVVDPRGSVHGVGRLTVLDASIIPEPTAGFPHVVTIMAAEKIAEQLAGEI